MSSHSLISLVAAEDWRSLFNAAEDWGSLLTVTEDWRAATTGIATHFSWPSQPCWLCFSWPQGQGVCGAGQAASSAADFEVIILERLEPQNQLPLLLSEVQQPGK